MGFSSLKKIEEILDFGMLVVVPQLSDKPTKTQLFEWLKKPSREYKTRIIDWSFKKLDHRIRLGYTLKWRDLDNRPLVFRGDFRPAARYFYFHYCLQFLRRAWKQPAQQPSLTLKDEIGKPYWGTPGRYLPKNMLLTFVEELGHEYDQLLEGASCSSGDKEVLLGAASVQIKAKDSSKSGMDSDEESSSEDSDYESD
ncbi:hypothetical protein FQN54_000710 [Arachnomyces sp. PD_36]|nr:hypothetical protein FQN54_000710 [Arachnomyces sp. PD_36]